MIRMSEAVLPGHPDKFCDAVAEAIAARDHGMLQTLPEIGKRTAETICVELKGKVDPFVRELGGTRPAAGTKAAAKK